MTSSQYLVLARKYRPTNFDELIGQDTLVQTIKNSIKNNKVAHAFLLTGIRGIGKTTTARIIAKTLNCANLKIENPNPCNVCNNCTMITKSNFQDVIEVDAASKTGVDDIRNIIESIQYAPTIGRYKIYIIDEIHMLSNNAFNAFLKTLEEPPAHVKFIFATTESHKIPATILSRCQKFNLRRLDNHEIENHLNNILTKENFEAEIDALATIANHADGSMRDALSFLDSALSRNNYQKLLTIKIIEDLIGIGDVKMTVELFELLYKGDIANAITLFKKYHQDIVDISQIHQNLLELTHKIILQKSRTNINDYGIFLNQKNKITKIVEGVAMGDLLKIWQIMTKTSEELRYSKNQKITFEILLVKICYLIDVINPKKVNKNNQENSPNIEHSYNKQNPDDKNPLATNDDNIKNKILIGEITRNFPNAKIIK